MNIVHGNMTLLSIYCLYIPYIVYQGWENWKNFVYRVLPLLPKKQFVYVFCVLNLFSCIYRVLFWVLVCIVYFVY